LLWQGQETNRQLLLRLKDKDTQLFRLREKNKELARINTVQKYQIKMQISTINNQTFEKPPRNPSNRTKVNINKIF
jgi:hypothetical protein